MKTFRDMISERTNYNSKMEAEDFEKNSVFIAFNIDDKDNGWFFVVKGAAHPGELWVMDKSSHESFELNIKSTLKEYDVVRWVGDNSWFKTPSNIKSFISHHFDSEFNYYSE